MLVSMDAAVATEVAFGSCCSQARTASLHCWTPPFSLILKYDTECPLVMANVSMRSPVPFFPTALRKSSVEVEGGFRRMQQRTYPDLFHNDAGRVEAVVVLPPSV